MKPINLLPAWARKKKQRRIMILTTATVQVAIFLPIFAILFVYASLEQRELATAGEWNARLQFIDPTWEQTATAAAAIRSNTAQLEDFLLNNSTYPFDAAWFAAIIETIPHGAEIVRMVYFDAEILITARTANITLAEIHRRAIASEEIFYNVMLGRIVGLDEGYYNYELRMQTQN